MFHSAIIVGLFLNSIAAYSQCNSADAKGPIEIPLTMALDPRYTEVKVSGKIIINDGCTFSLSELTFFNAGASKFMGGNVGSTDAITLSNDYINPSAGGGSQTFKFRSDAGSQASFKDFNEFRIFDETNQRLVATARVPSDLTKPSTQGTPTQGTPTQGYSPSGTANVNNHATPDSGSILILGLFLVYMMLF